MISGFCNISENEDDNSDEENFKIQQNVSNEDFSGLNKHTEENNIQCSTNVYINNDNQNIEELCSLKISDNFDVNITVDTNINNDNNSNNKDNDNNDNDESNEIKEIIGDSFETYLCEQNHENDSDIFSLRSISTCSTIAPQVIHSRVKNVLKKRNDKIARRRCLAKGEASAVTRKRNENKNIIKEYTSCSIWE